MNQRRRPNPDRFLEFEEFSNGSGFVIHERGKSIEFFYDQDRGWFDEDGNYFNSDGKPTTPSRESLKFWDSIKHEYKGTYDDYDDDLLNEYEKGHEADDYSDGEGQDFLDQAEREEQIEKLRRRLKSYPIDAKIKVYFDGANWRCKPETLIAFFGSADVKSVEFEVKGKFRSGRGHMMVNGRVAADRVLMKHRCEMDGATIYLDVEQLEDIGSDDEIAVAKHNASQQQQSQSQPNINTNNNNISSNNNNNKTVHRKDEKPQPVQQVKPQPPPQQQAPQQQTPPAQQPKPQPSTSTQQNPAPLLEGFKVLVKNLPLKETQNDITNWIKDKYPQFKWVGLQAKEDATGNRVMIAFTKKSEAEEFIEKTGKNCMYKGKNKLAITSFQWK